MKGGNRSCLYSKPVEGEGKGGGVKEKNVRSLTKMVTHGPKTSGCKYMYIEREVVAFKEMCNVPYSCKAE